MKHIACLCLALSTTTVSAQQALYAGNAWGGLVEIVGYDSTPTLRPVPFDPALVVIFAQDIAIRATTGTLFIHSLGLGLAETYEVDPITGALLNGTGCFGAVLCACFDSDLDGHHLGIGRPGFSPTRIHSTAGSPFCFDLIGPVTIANSGGMAIDRDGSLVSTIDGSTRLVRIDRATGVATPLGDPGLHLKGLEIDTDGTLYGLERTGGLHRIDRSTFGTTLVAMLPTGPPGSPGEWVGLTFRIPAGRIHAEVFCGGFANSTGGPAALWPWELPAPAPGRVELRASRLPLQSFGLLLISPNTGSVNVGAGRLCLGAPIQRVLPPVFSGASGSTSWLLDLGAIPGHGPVQSGDRLHFQAWYRDTDVMSQATVNFSDGVRVEFY